MNEKLTVKDIANHLEKLAPNRLSSSWDNTGLLVGDVHSSVSKILLTMDVTPSVIEKCFNIKADMIISHHPLFISPLKKITDPNLLKMIKNNIAVYCMHTNLDVINDGVSHATASALGLKVTGFLSELEELKVYHIAVYTPEPDVKRVSDAVFEAGAGVIGNYDHCLNSYPVRGQFKPLAGSTPHTGQKNMMEEVKEIKLEFFTDSVKLRNVLNAVHQAHPYETPAYAVYPLELKSLNYGLGVTAELPAKMTLQDFAKMVKSKLYAPFVKLWLAGKNPSTEIKRVALCGGNGSSIIADAEKKADVFVSSDFTYHRYLDSKIPLIDAGHFFTEYPVLGKLKSYLQKLPVEIDVINQRDGEINRLVVL